MSITWSKEKEGVSVVYFSESLLSDATGEECGDELLALADQPDTRKLLVNFSGVMMMSSAVIGKLILLKKACDSKEIDLRLSNIGPDVREVLDIMKFDKLFHIFSKEADAIDSFND